VQNAGETLHLVVKRNENRLRHSSLKAQERLPAVMS